MSGIPDASTLLAVDRLRRQLREAFPSLEGRRRVLAALYLAEFPGEPLPEPPARPASSVMHVPVQIGEPLTAWGRPTATRGG